jgi:hypothetical protein
VFMETKELFVLPGWCLGKHENCMVSVGADDQVLEDLGYAEDVGRLQ